MITITLEVDEITNLVYQNLTTADKEKINEDIREVLKKNIASARAGRLKKVLDEIARDPQGHGLNEEILSHLLREED
jgi:hypothetical protein